MQPNKESITYTTHIDEYSSRNRLQSGDCDRNKYVTQV